MGLGWVKHLLWAVVATAAAHAGATPTVQFDAICVQNYEELSNTYLMHDTRSTALAREDAHKIWAVYEDIGLRKLDSPAVRSVLKYVNATPQNEISVLNEFVRQIESGEACKDDQPSKSWVEILNSLRSFVN